MIVKNKEKLKKVQERVDPDLGLSIAADLSVALDDEGGIGLAAPQIGEQGRVFVIQRKDGSVLFAINPEIHSKDEPFIHRGEGCLSFPGKRVDTIRYNRITWTDSFREEPQSLVGIDAVAFQHEENHLDGILMFDVRVPKRYDPCFCGTGKKYKFCCEKSLEKR